MRTFVGLALALAFATGCIGRASGSGPTIQRTQPTDLAGEKAEQNQLPTSAAQR